jgi:hypothetical protein
VIQWACWCLFARFFVLARFAFTALTCFDEGDHDARPTDHSTPRFHAALALLFLTLGLMADTSPARAGTWVLDHYTQTGTDTDYAQQRNNMTRNWKTGNISPSGGGVAHGPGYYWYNQYSVSSAGTVTAVFVWQPASSGDQPVPFLVGITASASGAGDPADAVTYTLNDGFGDKAVPGGGGEVSQGTHYTLEPGGQTTVSVPTTVSAAATCPSDANDTCTASVSVEAFAYTPTVTLSGAPATTDGTATGPPEAMAGEQITATLVGLPPGCQVSYSWSTSGGSPFETYNYNLASNQKVALSTADMAATAFQFYDAGNDTVTVMCTAVVQPPTPSGGTPPPTLTVTVKSTQPVTFVKPSFAGWTIKHGFVQSASGDILKLAKGPKDSFANGEDWSDATVSFPANLPSALMSGQLGFAQIDTPDYTYTPAISNPEPNNNQPGLDTGFPLPGHWSVSVPSGSTTSAGGPENGDNPGTPAYTATKITSNEMFTTWLMYQPPYIGSINNVIWVPIAMYSWSWGGTATETNGIWAFSGLSPASSGSGGSASATSTYPTWTLIHAASD